MSKRATRTAQHPELQIPPVTAVDGAWKPAGTWTFRIPGWMPPMTNAWAYRHWTVKKKLTYDAEQWVGLHSQDVPKATSKRSVALLVTLGPRRRQCDRDAFDKILLDVLVRCGLLIDDGDKGLLGRMEVNFQRGSRSATQITLVNVE